MFPECIECRGTQKMCGISPCPLLTKIKKSVKYKGTKSLAGLVGPSPPSIFVGRYGYPNVRIGPSANWTPDGEINSDIISSGNPADLFGKSLEVVASKHANLVTGSKNNLVNYENNSNVILEVTQEIAMSAKSVDIEIDFVKPVLIDNNLSFDSISNPIGPSGDISRTEVIGHINIPRKVDSIVNETDLKVSQAMNELVDSDIGEAHISRMLSTGLLGISGNRKLVPTRWSITATDDILGKQLWEKIRDNSSLDKIRVHEAAYLDNHFYIILIPGLWAFQMMEVWSKGSLWNHSDLGKVIEDREDLAPRNKYASNITGAYYAARLGVLEHLNSINKSGACLIWRDIGPGYWAPVGVWLIRETIRTALTNDAKYFDTVKDSLNYLKGKVSKPSELENSWFINRNRQTRLDLF